MAFLQVRELKKRQQKQQERERKQREKQLEKERSEKESQLKLKVSGWERQVTAVGSSSGSRGGAAQLGRHGRG